MRYGAGEFQSIQACAAPSWQCSRSDLMTELISPLPASIFTRQGRVLADETVKVVVENTFINIVSVDSSSQVIRQMSAPGKLGGSCSCQAANSHEEQEEPFTDASSTASGTHSIARETDLASEDEVPAGVHREISLEERLGGLVGAGAGMDSERSAAILDLKMQEVARTAARNCDLTPIAQDRERAAGGQTIEQPRKAQQFPLVQQMSEVSMATPQSSAKRASANAFESLRQSADSGGSDDERNDCTPSEQTCLADSSASLSASQSAAKVPEMVAAQPSSKCSLSKNARRKNRVKAAAASEAADAAALEEAVTLASAEEQQAPASAPSLSSLSAKPRATKKNVAKPNTALLKTTAVDDSTRSKNIAAAFVQGTLGQCQGSVPEDRSTGSQHPGFALVFSDHPEAQRKEMKAATLEVFREMKRDQRQHSQRPAPPKHPPDQQLGWMTHLQLAKYGRNASRRLVSVYGHVFDVTSVGDKYGPGGEHCGYTGRDATWALITGDTRDCNQFYDIFKSGDLVTQYLRRLSSWIAFYESEYGDPVGNLLEFQNEKELPPPPVSDVADCVVM